MTEEDKGAVWHGPETSETIENLLEGLCTALLLDRAAALPKFSALTPAHFHFLRWLRPRPLILYQTARRKFGCPPAKTGHLTKDLLRLGLLECDKTPTRGSVCRRGLRLRLSEAGHDLLRQLEGRQQDTAVSLLEGLHAEERAILMEGLRVLVGKGD